MNRFSFTLNFLVTFIIDFILINLSLYLSYSLRFDFQIPEQFLIPFINALPFMVLLKIFSFFALGLYRGMWRYTSLADVINILKAATLSSLLIIAMVAFFSRFHGFPRSIFIVDWGFTILLICGFRIGIRIWFELHISAQPSFGTIYTTIKRFVSNRTDPRIKRLIIIGAGNCGEQIVREIQGNNSLGYDVVGFLDDNPKKH